MWIWVFVLGSMAGYAIEMGYCRVLCGAWNDRSGLRYGPFTPVYGIGALAMTAFAPLADSLGPIMRIAFAAGLGALIEYGYSWAEERLTGRVSWDYSHLPFHLHGRICLLYCVYWGILGAAYETWIWPMLSSLIRLIPPAIRSALEWLLTAGMLLDIAMTLEQARRSAKNQACTCAIRR